MEQYETGGSQLCSQMSELPTYEHGTPMANGTLATVGDPSVEMRFPIHGLCGGYTPHIWVVVDRLTKTTHFVAMRNPWTLDQLA